jgi:hypothetical protein
MNSGIFLELFIRDMSLHRRTSGCSVLAGTCFLVFFSVCTPLWAGEPADQLERARLLREQLESQPADASGSVTVWSLPGASLDTDRRATEGLRRQQLDDSQWRKTLGDQQMQLHQPSIGQPLAGGGAESQWRAQTFERERQAQDLSADILRRDREYRQGMRH